MSDCLVHRICNHVRVTTKVPGCAVVALRKIDLIDLLKC